MADCAAGGTFGGGGDCEAPEPVEAIEGWDAGLTSTGDVWCRCMEPGDPVEDLILSRGVSDLVWFPMPVIELMEAAWVRPLGWRTPPSCPPVTVPTSVLNSSSASTATSLTRQAVLTWLR